MEEQTAPDMFLTRTDHNDIIISCTECLFPIWTISPNGFLELYLSDLVVEANKHNKLNHSTPV